MNRARRFRGFGPYRGPEQRTLLLGGLVLALCAASAITLVPFWVPLLLAAWGALLVKPVERALAKRLRRRRWGAALVTVSIVVTLGAPLSLAVLSLAGSAVELARRLLQAGSGAEALRALTTQGDGEQVDWSHLDLSQLMLLAREYGDSGLAVAKKLFGAVSLVGVGSVVFVAAFYTFLLEGRALYEWLMRHTPLARPHFQRLSNAFAEVGHGLLVGMGLTALLQGIVAAIGYWVCGVTQPLVLGLVTMVAALIPSVGTALVWIPVTLGLWLSGRHGAAAAMLAIGVAVSLVDNLMRPLFAKYGELRMHGLLLFVAMLGGLAAFGAGGLLLGPLVVRLAIEGLQVLRDAKQDAVSDH